MSSLNCANNQLSTLDVSHNDKLEVLICDANGFTDLDLSYCPNLIEAYNEGEKTDPAEEESKKGKAWKYQLDKNVLRVAVNVVVCANVIEKLQGTVVISGIPKYGENLTASVTDTNNSGELEYQWKRSSDGGEAENISGATADTYKLTQADIGKIISCEVSSTVEVGNITGVAATKVENAVVVLKGDITGDRKVDAKDRMYLARAIAGWSGYTLPSVDVADFTSDNKVDAKDRMYLARRIAGWIGYE